MSWPSFFLIIIIVTIIIIIIQADLNPSYSLTLSRSRGYRTFTHTRALHSTVDSCRVSHLLDDYFNVQNTVMMVMEVCMCWCKTLVMVRRYVCAASYATNMCELFADDIKCAQ